MWLQYPRSLKDNSEEEPRHAGHPAGITTKAQDAPMGLMTGAWEVPLPKPIPRQHSLHTLEYTACRHHWDPPRPVRAVLSCAVLYLDVYVHAGAGAGADCSQVPWFGGGPNTYYADVAGRPISTAICVAACSSRRRA